MHISFTTEFIKAFLAVLLSISYLCYAGGIIALFSFWYYKLKGWDRLWNKSLYFAVPLFFFAATINIFMYWLFNV